MENQHALDNCGGLVCFMAFKPILRFGRIDTNNAASGTSWSFHQDDSGQKTGQQIAGEHMSMTSALIIAFETIMIILVRVRKSIHNKTNRVSVQYGSYERLKLLFTVRIE
jgi:hypothetical protein